MEQETGAEYIQEIGEPETQERRQEAAKQEAGEQETRDRGQGTGGMVLETGNRRQGTGEQETI